MVTCNYVTVPTRQSEVTDTQSHDNQPRQDDERSPVDDNNGMCVHYIVRAVCSCNCDLIQKHPVCKKGVAKNLPG